MDRMCIEYGHLNMDWIALIVSSLPGPGVFLICNSSVMWL